MDFFQSLRSDSLASSPRFAGLSSAFHPSEKLGGHDQIANVL
jgi:hypothetical protein